MATAKPIASTPANHPRRRWLRRVVLSLLLVALALLAWFRQPLGAYAITGAAYGARVGCACRFIERRELSDCRKDFEPGMALVRLSENTEARSITAGIVLMRHQTAIFREGQGCVLEKWAD
jgi:hypothetical protein